MLTDGWKHVTRAAMGLLLALVLAGVHAAPTTTPAVPPAVGNQQQLGNWSKEPQKVQGDAANDPTADLPTPEKLLEEHLSGPREGGRSSQPARQRPVPAAGTVAAPGPADAPRRPGASGRTGPESEIERAAKDAVRPVVDELSASRVVEAARELKAGLGLGAGVAGAEQRPMTPEQAAALARNNPNAELCGTPTSRAEIENRYRSAEQIKVDKVVAEARLEKFIQDAKPWAYGLLGVYLFWFFLKFALNYHHWSTMRRERRRTAHRHSAQQLRR